MACLVAFLLVNLAINPAVARQRSLVVMQAYDWYHEAGSVPSATGVRARLPLRDSGLYPLLATFNADPQMSSWLGAPVRFTVDYTFADFPTFAARSPIYDPDSPLHSAYVGSYHLLGMGRPLTASEVEQVAEFDQRALALPALGMDFADTSFEVLDTSASRSSFAGRDWTTHDASIRSNCPEHTPDGFLASYLQFGRPPATGQQYPLCDLSARIEVTYLPEQDLTVGLYVLAPSRASMERLSEDVVRRAELVVPR